MRFEVSTPVLDVRELAKVYRMGEVEIHALRQVSLVLSEGHFVVLLGPSGSGKSTLLNILGGLDVPTSGHVLYRNTDLTTADEAALTAYRRRHVGFVFQFYNLIPSLTARENVALVTEIAENPMAPDDALGLVHLDERRDHFPAQLSGGEQQCVAIARAIAKRPAVLLCDEPTGALDISTGHRRAGGARSSQRRSRDHDCRHHPQRRDCRDGRSRHSYRCKTPGSNDEVDFEELPHEGFCITKIRLPRVSLECRPDYEAHLLCCNMMRTDGRESEPTERMFNLSLTLDESDNVQLRQATRIFRTVDEAAECILKPVLFPLVDRRPPI